MNKLQKLVSPLGLIIIAALVIAGLVGYSEWSAQHKKDQVKAAMQSVHFPRYATLKSKSFQNVKKSQTSTVTVAAWVNQYQVWESGAGLPTGQVRQAFQNSLSQAGFAIDGNPTASQQLNAQEILAHKGNVSLEADLDNQNVTSGVVVIGYEK